MRFRRCHLHWRRLLLSEVPLESIQLPEGLTYIGRQALGAYVYNSDYTAQYWAGPAYVEEWRAELSGPQRLLPDVEIVAVLNSQRNMVVASSDLEKPPTVVWDGKTDIPFNDTALHSSFVRPSP